MAQQTFPIIRKPDASRERPVVVSVPHSGTIIPEHERRWYAVDVEKLETEGDLYVDELYRGAESFGATVIQTPYNRFLIDLNRLSDDFSPLSVSGARIRRDPGYYGHRGLIWAVTTEGQPIYRTPLPRAVVQRRLEQYYYPYHRALMERMQELRDEFGYAILIDAHSMPSRGSVSGFNSSARRADIVPGDLMGRSCGRWLVDAVVDY
jgi:N-formylglutamate amidohydrolase